MKILNNSSVSSSFPIQHSMLDVRCSMFMYFRKSSTVTRHPNLIASSLADSPTKKLHVQLVSTKSDPQLHLYTSRHQSANSRLASFISSAGQIFDRLAHSFVNSMTILRFNTENRKELSRSKARIVSPGGCICSKERNGINVANTNQLF
jgi:hypothetical protein